MSKNSKAERMQGKLVPINELPKHLQDHIASKDTESPEKNPSQGQVGLPSSSEKPPAAKPERQGERLNLTALKYMIGDYTRINKADMPSEFPEVLMLQSVEQSHYELLDYTPEEIPGNLERIPSGDVAVLLFQEFIGHIGVHFKELQAMYLGLSSRIIQSGLKHGYTKADAQSIMLEAHRQLLSVTDSQYHGLLRECCCRSLTHIRFADELKGKHPSEVDRRNAVKREVLSEVAQATKNSVTAD